MERSVEERGAATTRESRAVPLIWYLRVAFWAFALSGLAQVFATRGTAAASVWGFAPGWQREIGFFDLALALLAFYAIRSDDRRLQRALVLTFVVLTALVGSNHLATVLSGHTSSLHEVFTVVNYGLVVAGLAVIVVTRQT